MNHDEKSKTVIYLFVNGHWANEDVVSSALSEDGEFLAEHLSSNETWAKHDIGLTSDRKHKTYAEAYPEGYSLVWVDDAPNDERVQAAYAKHLAKYKTSDVVAEASV